jgi:hypothetical protein
MYTRHDGKWESKNGVFVKKILGVILTLGLCMSAVQVATAKSTAPTKTVYFSSGQSKLDASTKASLSALAKTIKRSDKVFVRGYVQKSGSSKNDMTLATARATSVKAYLVARGVKASISVKGYGLPKSQRSSEKSRRAEIFVIPAAVTPKPTRKPTTKPSPSPTRSPSVSPSPSTSPSQLGPSSISGSIIYAGCNRNLSTLEYVKLYAGSEVVRTINAPAWSDNPNACWYDYSFEDLPDGIYRVVHSFSVQGNLGFWMPGVQNPGNWTVNDGPTSQRAVSPQLIVDAQQLDMQQGLHISGVDYGVSALS